MRILLVEDNFMIAHATADMLTDMGHSAVIATKAAHALAVLAGGRPIDAIMLDWSLPDMNGDELARQIKADPRWSSTPIVLATGYAQGEEQEQDAEGLFAYVLMKPFSETQVQEALKSLHIEPPRKIATA